MSDNWVFTLFIDKPCISAGLYGGSEPESGGDSGKCVVPLADDDNVVFGIVVVGFVIIVVVPGILLLRDELLSSFVI